MVMSRCPLSYMGPCLQGHRVEISRLGWREPMHPCIVDRPQGTGDVLLMYFHDAVSIDGRDCPPRSLRCWPHGHGHRYGSLQGEWVHSWVHMHGALADRMASLCPEPLPVDMVSSFERHFRHVVGTAAMDADPELVELGLSAICRLIEMQQAGGVVMPRAWLELRAWLEQHLHLEHELDGLAARMGLAKSRFSERFVQLFGRAPLAWIQAARLERACWLLHDHNRSIADIARELGYEDSGYFGRLFKRRYGLTPTAWRRCGPQSGAAVPASDGGVPHQRR